MAGSMKAVTETGIELSNEERNLLSVAYKVDILIMPPPPLGSVKYFLNVYFYKDVLQLYFYTEGGGNALSNMIKQHFCFSFYRWRVYRCPLPTVLYRTEIFFVMSLLKIS